MHGDGCLGAYKPYARPIYQDDPSLNLYLCFGCFGAWCWGGIVPVFFYGSTGPRGVQRYIIRGHTEVCNTEYPKP